MKHCKLKLPEWYFAAEFKVYTPSTEFSFFGRDVTERTHFFDLILNRLGVDLCTVIDLDRLIDIDGEYVGRVKPAYDVLNRPERDVLEWVLGGWEHDDR